MAQLRITDSIDVERANLPIADYSIKREGFNVIPEADVAVSRDDLNGVTGLTPGEDRAYIEVDGTDVFGGIVRSPDRQGGISVLKVRGKAQYFVRAPSVPTGQQRIATDDSTLIQECIDATPQLTSGTLETVEAGQTWIFGGISQWEKATQVANAAGGELEVTPDGTVNYRAQIGADKTATALSPSNASFVEDTFVVSRDGVSGNTTHLLVTGVGQGTGQVEVAIVPADDSTTYSQYDRVETYTNPNWADGDDAIWDTRSNKDLKNEDAAAAYGQTLINELQNEEVRVDTRVKGNAVALGDRYYVVHPDEDVDEDLRAVEVIETLAAEGGTRYEVVFSNYSSAHQNPHRENHRDARRYAAGAYEGDLTQIQQGPGRGPVDVGHDYVIHVYYPGDVVAEVNAQLLVKGTNYRAFSQGAASGGGSSETTASSAGDSDNATMDFSRTTATGGLLQLTIPFVSGSGVTVLAYAAVQNADSSSVDVTFDIDNINSGSSLYSGNSETYKAGDSRLFEAVETGSNLEGDTIEFSFTKVAGATGVELLISAGLMVIGDHIHSVTYPNHTHAPNPGILDWDGTDQSPQHYPSNVDVVVNGVSQGESLGDGTGEFEATVDLAGDLSAGWNEIRLTSDGLGHLDATFSADLFRQSL